MLASKGVDAFWYKQSGKNKETAMFNSLLDDLKHQYRYGGMITRLIIINIAAFFGINILALLFTLLSGFSGPEGIEKVMRFFSLQPDLWHQLTHPWVFITSMFLHIGLWHLLFNMLMLYWFGRIVENLLGDKHILPLYLLSGLIGGIFYLITGSFIPALHGTYAYGASAAVMGFVIAAATLTPDSFMRLLLIGPVRLKYIAAALVLLDLFSIGWMLNTGGHFAHLGGALFGYFYINELRQGNDYSKSINKWFASFGRFARELFGESHKEKSPLKTVHRAKPHQQRKKRHWQNDLTEDEAYEEQLNAILEKIKKHGYDKLSREEKEFLFNASKKK